MAIPSPAPADPGVLYAPRKQVYTKDVYGPVRSAKSAILTACLMIYYVVPWFRWNRGTGVPNQAVLLDIGNERFYFFNIVLWPQDIYLLAGALILAAFSLFFVTSMFGRVWCGYTCPQTVWTDLFMTVERWIEGDRNTRMKRDAAPWTPHTWQLKLTKHAAWLGIAFWTGGAWIMYYADAPSTVVQFWTGTAAMPVYFFIGLFTLTTYLLAGHAREQVCTYMCPWPRFQAAMLDEQSLIVTYQAWRGEPRAAGRRDLIDFSEPVGDCIDCAACVNVCPTGIDIRNGTQLECINCGLCIDACNHVMEKTGSKPYLITWDTLARQKAKSEGRRTKLKLIRTRTSVYAAAVALVSVGLVVALFTRSTATLSVIHDRAPLFITLKDGTLRNGYTVKIANKTQIAANYTLHVEGLPGAVVSLPETGVTGSGDLPLTIGASAVGAFRVLVQGPGASLHDGRLPLSFTLHQPSGGNIVYDQLFMGPETE